MNEEETRQAVKELREASYYTGDNTYCGEECRKKYHGKNGTSCIDCAIARLPYYDAAEKMRRALAGEISLDLEIEYDSN
jgi:hypothetical protein